MATIPVREALNASKQSLTMGLVPGLNSYVGIGLSATAFTGTITVYASIDGKNFVVVPVQAYPWVEGAASLDPIVCAGVVASNLVLPAGNWLAVKVAVTAFTSGTVTASIAASADGSYQNAYQGQSSLWQSSTATAATNTLTVASATNHGWKVTRLIVTFGTTPTTGQVSIADGATTLQVIDLPLVAGANDLSSYLSGIASSPGNNLVISMPSGGGGVRTDINALVEAA